MLLPIFLLHFGGNLSLLEVLVFSTYSCELSGVQKPLYGLSNL